MTLRIRLVRIAALIAVSAAPFAAGVESSMNAQLPLGHPDFYPSPERPVGWRGDGSGAWPGATPVREWDAATGKNIAWKTAMPGPSFSQPIVVGDKVFTLADPNWLICLSAADGKILWQKAVNHTAAMPPEKAAKAREALAFWDAQFRQYSIWLDLKRGFQPNLPQPEIDATLKAADEHGFAVNAPGQANFHMIARGDPLWDRAWNDQTTYSVHAFGHWDGLLTQTFPTPVSDGECVFVNMANDQIACFDTEGNCRWLIWDRPSQAPPAKSEHVRYALSPRLIGEKLIVAACGELRAYDKRTGRKLWGVYHKKDFGAYWVKVSPPVPMQAALDDRPFDVLLSPGSGIYRLDDGKLLGTLPDLPGYEGATALTDGKIHVRKDAPDSGSGTRLAGRLKVVSADQVEFEELWRTSGRTKGGNTTDVLFDGSIYSPQNGVRVSIATGESTEITTARGHYSAPALGGRLLVIPGTGGYGHRDNNPGVMNATVTALDEPASAIKLPAAFVDRRYLEDEAFRLRWRWRGNGDGISNSSPAFQANRMFFRTAGYLWCIGDPQQPWQNRKIADNR